MALQMTTEFKSGKRTFFEMVTITDKDGKPERDKDGKETGRKRKTRHTMDTSYSAKPERDTQKRIKLFYSSI